MEKNRKKWFIIGAGILIVLALIGSSMLKALDVDTYTVKKKDVTATVWEKGKVKSQGAEDIYSEVQGRVKTIKVDSGDVVEKGALLAVLDITELEAQIAQLEGELKSIKGMEQASQSQPNSARIEQQRSIVEQAWIAVDLAQSAYERTKDLYDNGAVTKVELNQAKADLETKEKALAQAEASLEALKKESQGSKLQYQGQRESLEAQLDYLRKQKDKAQVTAGIDGIVFSKSIKEGDPITPGTLLFTVGQKGKTDIETYVNYKDIVNVKEEDEVTIVFKVPGDDVESVGMIKKIAPAAEEKVSSLGITEDKIKVTVELKKKPVGIKVIPGMTVDVILITQEAQNVIAVPREAVFTDKGEEFIWVVKDGSANLQKVIAGIEGDDLLEIKSGLKEGDSVIINPHQTGLEEGVKVK